MAAKPKKQEVWDSLEAQLRDRGADVAHFLDQLHDYMFFYDMERKAQADIRKRGSMVMGTSASGYEREMENPSVKQAALYSQQKLNILRQMGLTTDTCRKPCEEEEDL